VESPHRLQFKKEPRRVYISLGREVDYFAGTPEQRW
jgi:hypothetical protein